MKTKALLLGSKYKEKVNLKPTLKQQLTCERNTNSVQYRSKHIFDFSRTTLRRGYLKALMKPQKKRKTDLNIPL